MDQKVKLAVTVVIEDRARSQAPSVELNYGSITSSCGPSRPSDGGLSRRCQLRMESRRWLECFPIRAAIPTGTKRRAGVRHAQAQAGVARVEVVVAAARGRRDPRDGRLAGSRALGLGERGLHGPSSV